MRTSVLVTKPVPRSSVCRPVILHHGDGDSQACLLACRAVDLPVDSGVIDTIDQRTNEYNIKKRKEE